MSVIFQPGTAPKLCTQCAHSKGFICTKHECYCDDYDFQNCKDFSSGAITAIEDELSELRQIERNTTTKIKQLEAELEKAKKAWEVQNESNI